MKLDTSTVPRQQRAGLILAGGESRRMGQNKAELVWQGQTFLERITQAVGAVCGQVWISVSVTDPLVHVPTGVQRVADRYARRGPLEGLYCGLHAAGAQADWVFVTGCDTPLVQPAFIEFLFSRCHNGVDAVVPAVDGLDQPLAAVYHRRVAPEIQRQLDADERSLRALLHQLTVQRVTVAELYDVDPQLNSLRNINSPHDLQQLEGHDD